MKSILFSLVLVSLINVSLAQNKYLFMRDALYQDSNFCAFLVKPGNNLLIGQIFNTRDINQQVADSLELDSFVFPVGLDSNKIVGFKVKNLPLEFDDKETIERWGTSKNKTYIKPSAINRSYRKRQSSSIISVKDDGSVIRDLQPFYERQINQSRQTNTRAVNFDNIKNSNYYFYAKQDRLFAFNPSISKIIAFDYSGNAVSKTKIDIEKPALYSNKAKYLINDKLTEDFYLIVQTNFSFNVYILNVESGKALFLESLAGVWEKPNWRIENGVLSYTRANENFEVGLNKQGTH
jgi:hypothetical protein